MWLKNPAQNSQWMKSLTADGSTPDGQAFNDALEARLLGLALLDGVPLHYLVPDPEMVPPESIRFFFLDPNWIECLLAGALAAATIGSMDDQVAASLMRRVRGDVTFKRLLEGVTTGFLLRSSLVHRYPGMGIRALRGVEDDAPVAPLLRRRQIGDSILLALFGGTAMRVELLEPSEGTHFAVQGAGGPWTQDVVPIEGKVLATGKVSLGGINVPVRPDGMLNLEGLQAAILAKHKAPERGSTKDGPVPIKDDAVEARHIAATLQNRPCRRIFRADVPETFQVEIRPPTVRAGGDPR